MVPNELRVRLLGGFDVTVGGTPVSAEAWRRRKPAALLKSWRWPQGIAPTASS